MTKRDDLLAMLQKDWVAVDVLCAQLGWQPHTVRGAISTLGKSHAIERKRENGCTYYRVAPVTDAAKPPHASPPTAPTSGDPEIPEFLRR